MKPSNIVLVGFMGTGKTSVGKHLAQTLEMQFIDMDDLIVKRAGKSIPDIFAQNGEPHFRAIEKTIAKELSKQAGLVIATGGGIVLDPENIANLGKTGIIACLSSTPEKILERVSADTNRPLLANSDKLQKIKDLLDKRKPLYDAIPLQIDTTDLTVQQVVEKITGEIQHIGLTRKPQDSTPRQNGKH